MKKSFLLIFTFTLLIIITFCSCGLSVTQVENTTSESVLSSKEETTGISKTETTTQATDKPTTEAETTTEQKSEKTVEITTKKTTAVSTTKQVRMLTCFIEISCKNVLENYNNLSENKRNFLPENGEILTKTQIAVPEGSTAFDVIKKACTVNVCTDNCLYCQKSGIQLDYIYTPGYDNYYIRGIHQIYEKDCGSQSGWMYCVNGVFPNYGCSQYKIQNGDTISFLYTCDLGEDLGAGQ